MIATTLVVSMLSALSTASVIQRDYLPGSNGVQIHPNGDNSKCLAPQSSNIGKGTPLIVTGCTGAQEQRFYLNPNTATGISSAVQGWCLDSTTGKQKGVAMKFWTCGPSLSWFQQTFWYSANNNDNHISVYNGGQFVPGGLCFQLQGDGTVTLNSCNGDDGRKWTTTQA